MCWNSFWKIKNAIEKYYKKVLGRFLVGVKMYIHLTYHYDPFLMFCTKSIRPPGAWTPHPTRIVSVAYPFLLHVCQYGCTNQAMHETTFQLHQIIQTITTKYLMALGSHYRLHIYLKSSRRSTPYELALIIFLYTFLVIKKLEGQNDSGPAGLHPRRLLWTCSLLARNQCHHIGSCFDHWRKPD